MSAGPTAAHSADASATSSSLAVIEMGGERHHQPPVHQALNSFLRGGLPARVPGPGRHRGERLHQPARACQVAHEQQVLDLREHDLHDLVPARGVLFDHEQVEQQLEVEAANARVADRGEPSGNAGGRVVGNVLDLERVRPDSRQLEVVGLGDEGPVRVGDEHLLDLRPDVPEVGVGAHRRRRQLLLGHVRDGPLPGGPGGERAERFRQPLGAAALRADRARHELGEHRVGHPQGDLAHQLRFLAAAGARRADHLQQDLRREARGGRGHVAQHLVERGRVVAGHVAGQRREDAEQRFGPGVGVGASRRLFLHPRDEVAQSPGVRGDGRERLQRLFVQVNRVQPEAVRDDGVPGRLVSRVALLEETGVVQFHHLDPVAPGRRP